MKKIILSIFLSLTILENMVFAENKTTFYEGTPKINLTYYKTGFAGRKIRKIEFLKANLTAVLNETENGRATLRIRTDELKDCAGFSDILYAEEDGFGSYALYANKEDWTNGSSLGTVIKYENEIELSFIYTSAVNRTLGKKNWECIWQLGYGFNTRLTSTKQK